MNHDMRIEQLEDKVALLEWENIEMTNALYEMENRLQAQIDKIHPVIYNIQESPNV